MISIPVVVVTLYLWTPVAGKLDGKVHDWRPMGEFSSMALCEKAREALSVRNRSQCVTTSEKAIKP